MYAEYMRPQLTFLALLPWFVVRFRGKGEGKKEGKGGKAEGKGGGKGDIKGFG